MTKLEDMSRGQYVFVLVIVALLAVIALSVAAMRQQRDSEEWNAFRAEHHCQARSRTGPPAGIATAPGQTTWVCDDGQTYVRNDD